jgi:hypothetical protein
VSGFALWSVLHPRIERYLDDPSRDPRAPRGVHTVQAFEAAARVEADSAEPSRAASQHAAEPIAA